MDKWQPPYNKDGSTTKREYFSKRKTPGVYIIKNKKTNEITYIGMSGVSVYKTLYRHFQYWNGYHEKKRRVYYTDRSLFVVRIIPTRLRAEAEQLEKRLIEFFLPCDNFEYIHDVELIDVPF